MSQGSAEVTPGAVRRALMNLLARREQSQTELLQKGLQRFAGCEELVREELRKLCDEGLQSDTRMAESFVSARAGRGQGPLKIRADLRARRVDDSAIEQALVESGVDWEELAFEVDRRRYGDSPPRDARERAKRIRFLQQRGFLIDQIRWLR